MAKKYSRHAYLLAYSIIFAVFAAGVFFIFPWMGKSFIWKIDGEPQYIPYLAYMGKYLRAHIFRFIRGDFTVQMFDFTIGYGDDVHSVVGRYPLDYLSVLVPVRYTEYLYTFLILFRMYLAGLSMSACCLYLRAKNGSFQAARSDILTASMIYVFCTYMLRYGVMHPHFITPFILLPLILLAAERMMQDEGYLLFSFSIFLGFICSYYFMYMMAIALLLYVLIRFPSLFPSDRWKNFRRLFLRMAGAFLLGTALAMVVLLPNIYRLVYSTRSSADVLSSGLLAYGPGRWCQMFVNLIAPKIDAGYSSELGFAAPVLPAALLLLTEKRKEKTGLKTALILGYIMLIVPIAAYIMTAFSALNNRWIFIYAFVIALVYASEAEHLRMLGKRVCCCRPDVLQCT